MDRLTPLLETLIGKGLSWEGYRERVENLLCDLAAELDDQGGIPFELEREALVQDALNEAVGYGPIEELLLDESVREILVNDPLHIYANRGVELEREPRVFSGEVALYTVIQRLLRETGVRLSMANPTVDVRRGDGLRVTAVIAPIARNGPVLTLSRSQLVPLALDDLIANETMSPQMAEFLEACIRARKNILVVGGAGAGKTTLLNGLAAGIANEDRIVTIEDRGELMLPQENVVTLEPRPSSHGEPGIDTGELVKIALRLRPDRVVLSDLTSEDALELLRATNAGCEGVLASMYALDAQSALDRLEAMCLMSACELPVRTVRELVANGIDLLVILTRYASGERKVTNILEVAGLDVDLVNLQEVFYFEAGGTNRPNRHEAVQGRFRATGFVPRFYEDLRNRGLAPARDLFR